jgi:hypothetical protein
MVESDKRELGALGGSSSSVFLYRHRELHGFVVRGVAITGFFRLRLVWIDQKRVL